MNTTPPSIIDNSQKPIPPFFRVLREVDEILLRVELIITASHSHSPFNDYLTRLSPEQAREVNNGISELRTAMLCLAHREGVYLHDQSIRTAAVVRLALQQALSILANAPPIDDIGKNQPHASDLNAPERLLVHMANVFQRMDRTLAEPMQTKRSNHEAPQ